MKVYTIFEDETRIEQTMYTKGKLYSSFEEALAMIYAKIARSTKDMMDSIDFKPENFTTTCDKSNNPDGNEQITVSFMDDDEEGIIWIITEHEIEL